MDVLKQLGEFIESIPDKDWKLNTSSDNPIIGFGIITMINGIKIDVRLKDIYPSASVDPKEGLFYVNFIYGMHNQTTIMKNFRSHKLLTIYNKITSSPELSALEYIYMELTS